MMQIIIHEFWWAACFELEYQAILICPSIPVPTAWPIFQFPSAGKKPDVATQGRPPRTSAEEQQRIGSFPPGLAVRCHPNMGRQTGDKKGLPAV